MNQALDALRSLILALFYAIMGAIAWIEGFLRGLMAQAGIGRDVQTPVLIVVAVLLIVAALRLFGRVFGVLIALFLVLLLVHLLVADSSVAGGSVPR